MILDKYPKVYRIPLHEYSSFPKIDGKLYMEKETSDQLLGNGLKFVREKLDGVSKFSIIGGHQVFIEDLELSHVVPYTQLPAYKIAYDARLIDDDRWLKMEEFLVFTMINKLQTPPLLMRTRKKLDAKELIKIAKGRSTFNPEHKMEGLIVINDKFGLTGKIVNPEYDEISDDKPIGPEINLLRS